MPGWMSRLSVAIGVSALAIVAGAGSALADGHGWKHKHKHHFVPPGHVHVIERPVYVERPVMYGPTRSMYRDMGYYGPPPAPSLNINIPLY